MQAMSDSPFPGDGNNPFAGMPLFGDLARMLQSQGPLAWDAARQLALSTASGGRPEVNVDPIERIKLEQLARVADLHVTGATGLTTSVDGRSVQVVPVSRTTWAHQTLDDLRPLFERLAEALGTDKGGPATTAAGPGADPSTDLTGLPDEEATDAWLSGLMQFLSPMMLGMTAGSLVGNLAVRSLGQYDLPNPRPRRDTLPVVIENLAAFGDEWSLDGDDLRLWICLHELTHHAVFGVPHVRQLLDELLGEWTAGFETDPHSLERRLGEIDPAGGDPMASFQQLLSDPELLLGAVRTPAQAALQPRLEALVLVVTGYVDNVMDRVGTNLIGSYGMVTEAIRRRRVEASASDRFVERLFGLELTQDRYDRGAAFVDGVVERAGTDALDRLWRSADQLPTPAELDAPGLWLARIDLPT
jgi:putative hydrolase